MIEPRDSDFFIIKPQFSGFYSTNLSVLLPKLGVRKLILTGIATEICILFTADAHMRDYALWVPENAVVGIDQDQAAGAIAIMKSDARSRKTIAAPSCRHNSDVEWTCRGFDAAARAQSSDALWTIAVVRYEFGRTLIEPVERRQMRAVKMAWQPRARMGYPKTMRAHAAVIAAARASPPWSF
nr:isochorismatase family cysteine hydrolase [Hephaestia sp. MAHUQ-44]